MESLEILFFQYLRETNQTVSDYDFNKWIAYFKQNATFRTVCQDCYDEIELDHKMEQKRDRAAELIESRNRLEQEQIKGQSM